MSVSPDPSAYRNACFTLHIALDLLHDVLNLVMGWEDYHLHEFQIGTHRYTEDPEEADQGKDENGVVPGSLLSRERMKFTYLYDFGDGRRHTVKVERTEIIPDGHGVRLTCLGGRRACPPEDVGGIHGYIEYLEALTDPKHPEHKTMSRWRGPFDPEALDVDAINQELARLIRWSRPRKR